MDNVLCPKGAMETLCLTEMTADWRCAEGRGVCVCLYLGRDGGQAITEPFEEDLGVLAYPMAPTEYLGLWASSELGSDANYE